MKRLQLISGVTAVFLMACYLHHPVDLRDESLRKNGISKQQEAEGRRLLQQMAETHGKSCYQAFQHHELTFTNTGVFARIGVSPLVGKWTKNPDGM